MRTSDNPNQPETLQGEGAAKRKKVRLPKHSRLNKRMIKAFEQFTEYVPAARLSRNLRDLLLLYLALDEDGLPESFEEFPADFYFLLQFMDAIAEEMEKG